MEPRPDLQERAAESMDQELATENPERSGAALQPDDCEGRDGDDRNGEYARPTSEGVSFAAVLASLDDGHAVMTGDMVEAPPAPLAATSSTEGHESGSRQSDLSHWLK